MSSGITTEQSQPTWAEGPAGEIPPDTRAPAGWTPQSQQTTEFLTRGCPPGTQYIANLGYINGNPVSGCYPLPCPLPDGFQYAPGFENAPCGAAPPAGWQPFAGVGGAGLAAGGSIQPVAPPDSARPFAIAGPAWQPPTRPPGYIEGTLSPPGTWEPMFIIGHSANFVKSKYPLVNPGTPWPGSPDYLYISIGNPNPRTSRAPPFIPEAPVGYTFTFMLPPPAPTMDMFSRLDDEVRSFTFQYVDTAKLVARQAQQAPVAPIPTGPDDVPLPPFSLPPLVHRPMSVTQWDGDYERGARLGDAHIAQLTRSTVALEMNCAPRPGWIDQGAAFVVPRSTQEILRSSAGTAADARLQNSPDAAWGADRGKATSDQVQRSRSVHDHLLNLMTTAWGFKLLAPLVAEVIRAGPWEPFIDSMLAYLDNSGRHRVFSLPRLVSQVPALLDTIGGMLRWATFRAAEEILRNGGRTCFELNGALQIENNVYGRSIWYLVLGHFTLGFRAFVIPGTGRRGGPTSIPSPIPEDRMEIVLWAADRFDINAFAGVLGGNWAERAAFDGIEFPDIRALHGMRMARAFNLLARMPTIVVEWERRRPERARWTGVAMDSDEGSDLAPAWSNPSNSEVNEFNPPSTRSIGAPR